MVFGHFRFQNCKVWRNTSSNGRPKLRLWLSGRCFRKLANFRRLSFINEWTIHVPHKIGAALPFLVGCAEHSDLLPFHSFLVRLHCVVISGARVTCIWEDLAFGAWQEVWRQRVRIFYHFCPLVQWDHNFFRNHFSVFHLPLDWKYWNFRDFLQQDSRALRVWNRFASRLCL